MSIGMQTDSHLHCSGFGVFCDVAEECLLHNFKSLLELRCELWILQGIPHSLQVFCISQEIVIVGLGLRQSRTRVALQCANRLTTERKSWVSLSQSYSSPI